MGSIRACAVLLFVGAVAGAQGPSAEVSCRLEPSDGGLVGTCSGSDFDQASVVLERDDERLDTLWSGSLEVEGQAFPLAIATYSYDDGPRFVLRSPFAWSPVTRFTLHTNPILLTWSSEEEAPPSQIDVRILERARELLGDPAVWDREDDRVCDPSDAKYTVYCALAAATREGMGDYLHRQPAMQVARVVVEQEWGERIESHRLMDFNNHPETTFLDVQRLFELARERVLAAAE